MANVDNPHGLLPLYSLGGGPWVHEEFSKAVGYGTALYPGDAVARVADNTIETPATPGTTRITGVNLNWGAASKATTHLVVVSPDVVFDCQADGSLDEADMGLNANLIYNAGDATALKSGHEVNSATEDVTSTLDVHLLKKLAVPGNDYGAYARLEILINKHRMASDAVGV
ncbi:MAG: hypothetical protein FJW34_00075 [Acidobacteria bacterium]|nr:hypothetical protein [Acidobacteriota bacterium]